MRLAAWLVAAALAGCGDDARRPVASIAIVAPAGDRAALTELVARIPVHHFAVVDAAPRGAVQIVVAHDLTCRECFRVDAAEGGFAVHTGDLLGAQYGVAAVLEELGFRFYHPYQTYAPPRLLTPRAGFLGVLHQPAIAERGLHLHTLHPIEPFYDFWVPSAAGLERAKAVCDWIVKNRGNTVQWVALDDIVKGDAVTDAWRAHTRAIIDYAHARGLTVGLGIQIFGASNLQQAFDLLDHDDDPDPAGSMRQRMNLAFAGMGFDRISLSFGEFFGADPQRFIDMVNLATQIGHEVAPQAQITATIHVGNSPSQRVTYMGESLIYYFLVKFADPSLVPWIHTVMYYDLFEPTSGAYLHPDFHEHRDYLLGRINAGLPAGYHPESAYWIAFDDSVPIYLPLYVRSRYLDLSELRARTAASGHGLGSHVLFSSGWEWGYWQNDWAVLHMSYELPATADALFEDMFAPYGAPGHSLAQAVGALAEAQHETLITGQLGAYLAARDAVIEIGQQVGVVSQPQRVSFDDLAAMSATERASFAATVLAPLSAHAARLADIQHAAAVSGMPAADPWYREVADGIAVDLLRTRFVVATYQAVLDHLGGGDATRQLDLADSTLVAARGVIARRHAALHDPEPTRLLNRGSNATLYQYGYLYEADTACYWDRELAFARKLVTGAGDVPPGCVLAF